MTTACLLGHNQYSGQAVTETDVELLLVPRLEFLGWLDRSEEFREFVFNGFSERLADMLNRINLLATQSIDQRLAAALFAHLQNAIERGAIELTHEELAIEIGSVREVVSRRLAHFEKNDLLARHRASASTALRCSDRLAKKETHKCAMLDLLTKLFVWLQAWPLPAGEFSGPDLAQHQASLRLPSARYCWRLA